MEAETFCKNYAQHCQAPWHWILAIRGSRFLSWEFPSSAEPRAFMTSASSRALFAQIHTQKRRYDTRKKQTLEPSVGECTLFLIVFLNDRKRLTFFLEKKTGCIIFLPNKRRSFTGSIRPTCMLSTKYELIMHISFQVFAKYRGLVPVANFFSMLAIISEIVCESLRIIMNCNITNKCRYSLRHAMKERVCQDLLYIWGIVYSFLQRKTKSGSTKKNSVLQRQTGRHGQVGTVPCMVRA